MAFIEKLLQNSFWTRLLQFVFILLLLFFIYQHYTLRNSINDLKAEISILKGKNLAPSQLNQIEYKVTKLTEDKDFFRSLYADNSTWFVGLVSLFVALAGIYTVYSNKTDLKEHKNETEKTQINFQTEVISKIEGFESNIERIKKDLYGSIAFSFLERALTIREKYESKRTEIKDYTYILVNYAQHLYYTIFSPEDMSTHIDNTFQEIMDIIGKNTESIIRVDEVIPPLYKLKEFRNPSINEKVDKIVSLLINRSSNPPKP